MRQLCAIVLIVTSATVLATGCSTLPGTADSHLPAYSRDDGDSLVVLGVPNLPDGPRAHAGSTQRGYADSTRYAVSDNAARALQSLADEYHLTKVSEWPIDVLQMQCAVFRIPGNATRSSLLAQLQADSRVQLAQPLQSFATQVAGSGGEHTGYDSAVEQMDVLGAHRQTQGKGVRIAIIDTGIDAGHPGLTGRIEAIRNFVDTDSQQFQRDRHGTAVGGVIAANREAGVGLIGVAPAASLLVLKACWQLEPGQDAARCNSYTIAQALAKAIELHAQIINLSLSGPPDPILSALCQKAIAAGIIIVGAGTQAGNVDGFPAAVPGVLKVLSSESLLSSQGALRAPGSEVLTLAPGGRYNFSSGDSIATAAISGVTALLLSRQRNLNADDLQQLLMDSSDEIANGGTTTRMVNACRAIALLSGVGQRPECAPTAPPFKQIARRR